MSEELDALYRAIVTKVRLLLKQRLERTLDYLLLPCLPGEDTQYKVTIKLTEKELQLNIPSRSLSMTLFRSSSDTRSLREIPIDICREFSQECEVIRLFALRLRKTITN